MTERQQEILSHLDVRGAMSIRELAAVLFVSEASVRRDVALLEKAGALRRVHGGVLPAGVESVVPLLVRDGEHSAQKERIASRAAEMVPDGATILLDASSTVRPRAQARTDDHHQQRPRFRRARRVRRRGLLHRRAIQPRKSRVRRPRSGIVRARNFGGYAVLFKPGYFPFRRNQLQFRA